MPCPFTGPKMFCAGPNLFKNCGSHKHLMPDKRRICSQENWFLCRQKSFWRGTKCSQILWLAQKFGPAQNVLGPVKGQGIRLLQGPKYPVLPTLSYIPRKSSLAFEAACLEPSFSICYKSLKVLINFEFALLRWSEWIFLVTSNLFLRLSGVSAIPISTTLTYLFQ